MEEPSQVGEARRLTVPLCRLMRFSEVDIGRISLIVTEAATNLVKHAAAGELLIRTLECGGVLGLEILATDRGPGMANPPGFCRTGFPRPAAQAPVWGRSSALPPNSISFPAPARAR